jgi:hypothetical protein
VQPLLHVRQLIRISLSSKLKASQGDPGCVCGNIARMNIL